jgi:hypothetical protein
MRRIFLCAGALGALGAIGCGAPTSTYVKSDTTLGRVVVYRNGVAYFERYADVQGDSLKLKVPEDKVDDFLKSLTVVDAQTGEPAPISYPSVGAAGTIDMKIGVTKAGPRKLRLSYVTEAPSWKPSYRVVVRNDGKVDLQGWAIVDNTSGEDWKDVRLGVGASSAMSFRFDLKGLRVVRRETLHENDLFAQAPPMGGASYGQPSGPPSQRVVADVPDDALAFSQRDHGGEVAGTGADNGPRAARPPVAAGKAGGGGFGKAANASTPPPADPKVPAANANDARVAQMAQSLRATPNTIVVEGYAAPGDEDKMRASLERANRLRNELVRNGVDPSKVVARGLGEVQGRAGGARVVEAPALTEAEQAKKPRDVAKGDGKGQGGQEGSPKEPTEPIGTSHFESTAAMTVPRGTSAMVSILRSVTDGEVVYLYDPESPRGNAQFPFKTLRFKNPTDGALESGPVSVFGEGRFVGEGLADPIPARQTAFVPFALDRQIVVERKDDAKDEIAKVLTVQRGVFHTEIKHTKRASFTLYNRLPEKAVVYLRHSVAQGYKLTKAPAAAEGGPKADEHLGGARLFRIEVPPNGKQEVTIEEATPIFRTTDIRTPAGLDLVRAYVSNAALEGGLEARVKRLLDLHGDMTKIEAQIATLHEQMNEYRQRMDELHQQIFTLKAVKTAGPLMGHLEKKLQEVSEKLSKATVDVVTLQEKHMVARVEFQNGVGDLSLEKDKTPPSATAAAK